MEITLYQGLLEFNWNLLLSAVTVLVLYLILKRYFFEKVHDVLMERQVHIEEQLTHAKEMERNAGALLEEYSWTLANAEEEKRSILRQARAEADQRAEKIIEKARDEAAELNSRTHEKLAHEEEKILHRLHEEIAELAVLAAGQILQREVKETDYTELVDRVIEEAKTAKWENQ